MNTNFAPLPALALPAHADLIAAFLAGRCDRTLRSYSQSLEDFATFVGAGSMNAGAHSLLARAPGEANAMVLAYRAHLVARDLAANTINLRLAALRSLVKLARTLGFVTWSIEIGNVPAEAYRDTRGPGSDGVRKLLGELAKRTDAKGRRDLAIVRLLFDLALRRCEVCRLDLADFDAEAKTLAVRGKGKRSKQACTLPGVTCDALAAWIAARGEGAGPLFVHLSSGRRPPAEPQASDRITGHSLYRIVRRLGDRTGVKARPHGLRHASVTAALEATGGDVRKVQRFSRHSDLRTVLIYDDNRHDLAGEVAKMVSEIVNGTAKPKLQIP